MTNNSDRLDRLELVIYLIETSLKYLRSSQINCEAVGHLKQAAASLRSYAQTQELSSDHTSTIP